MDDVVTGALIGVGGVVLGVALTAGFDYLARRHVREEQREQARHARELVAAEQLDEALIRASEALDRNAHTMTLEQRYVVAHKEWEAGWVAYSPRIRQPELLDRYSAVGGILNEVLLSGRTTLEVPRRLPRRAIANARATLAYFMRGDKELPATSFPEPTELIGLLGEGDGLEDPMEPLKDWVTSHPEPEFH